MGLGTAAIACASRRAAAASSPNRPRALLQIVCVGGIDALLTTDPKTTREVDPRIALSYAEDAIGTVGGVRLGPLLQPLARHIPKMAIINGVQGGTVSHMTGLQQLAQGRRIYPPGSTGLAGLVGGVVRRDEPCDEIIFADEQQIAQGNGRTVRNVDGVLLEGLATALRDQSVRRVLQAELHEQLASVASGERRLMLEVNEGLVRALSAHELPATIPLELPLPDVLTGMARAQDARWARMIRDVLFLFEHRITPAIALVPPASNWDSHQDNELKQQWCMDRFAPHLSYVLDAFERVRTSDGVPLSEQVGILISSELGRFPIKNEMGGKDHFPEFPAIFIGPGVRPGQYGSTDHKMTSQPISLRTGHPSSARSDVIPTLDDLGATVLSWFGIEDTIGFGYTGRRLDFVVS